MGGCTGHQQPSIRHLFAADNDLRRAKHLQRCRAPFKIKVGAGPFKGVTGAIWGSYKGYIGFKV